MRKAKGTTVCTRPKRININMHKAKGDNSMFKTKENKYQNGYREREYQYAQDQKGLVSSKMEYQYAQDQRE